uniref:ORF3 n=1 Tax=Zoothera dauma adenovirus TaxID=3073259 RepID=A0AA51NPG4_9ADEN|nr:ORF3 [Zoothera dauma adenovirus]
MICVFLTLLLPFTLINHVLNLLVAIDQITNQYVTFLKKRANAKKFLLNELLLQENISMEEAIYSVRTNFKPVEALKVFAIACLKNENDHWTIQKYITDHMDLNDSKRIGIIMMLCSLGYMYDVNFLDNLKLKARELFNIEVRSDCLDHIVDDLFDNCDIHRSVIVICETIDSLIPITWSWV